MFPAAYFPILLMMGLEAFLCAACSFSLTHETPSLPHAPLPEVEMQRMLMQSFFYDINYSFIDEASKNDPNSDVCSPWHGIQCEKGLVRAIKYANARFGNFNLLYTPQTVKALELSDCRQSYSVQTKALPRDALSVCLKRNTIHGTINLSTLPAKIRIFNVTMNNIVGPISLIDLPKSMEKLSVSCNNIRQEVVYYENLPGNIMQIHIRGAFGHNRIQRVQSVSPDYKCKDKKVFVDILPNDID